MHKVMSIPLPSLSVSKVVLLTIILSSAMLRVCIGGSLTAKISGPSGLAMAMTTMTRRSRTPLPLKSAYISSSSFCRRTRSRTSSSSSKGTKRAYHRIAPTMMPEGPEVRTLVDQLQPAVGRRLVNMQFVSGRYTKDRHGPPKGFEEFSQTMTSYTDKNVSDNCNLDTVQDWNCKGKFIWLTLDQGKLKSINNNSARTHTHSTAKSDAKVDVDLDVGVESDFHRTIWITLGMTGRFVREAFTQPEEDDGRTHNQPRWYFEFLEEDPQLNPNKDTRKIYYYDTRNFGTLRFSTSKQELEDKLKSLGPDILGGEGVHNGSDTDTDVSASVSGCTEEDFMMVFRRPRSQGLNVCKFLMDQSKIAGVGNYILAESLYRSNIDPFASLNEISDDQAKILYHEVMDIAKMSYRAQGMTRAKGGSYRDINGNEGTYTFSLQCYGRDTCPRGNKVIRETNGPHRRTIWYVEDQLFMPREEREALALASASVTASKGTRRKKAVVSTVKNKRNSDSDSNDNANTISIGEEKNDNDHTDLSLINSLTDDGWKGALSEFLSSEKFSRLSNFVASERRLHTIYPPPHQVFSALNICPLDDVKVVIIGQDPYHGPNQGHGLAFSVQKGINPPPSLKNIYKELVNDEGTSVSSYPTHGNLECWAKQGVLLLNTVLTVQHGKANSHSKMGWEDFTDEIVNALNHREKDGLVFLLWGRPAAQKGKGVDVSRHTVITTSHPSPLGATKTNSPFLVSVCRVIIEY